MCPTAKELAIIVPVWNECDCVGRVLTELRGVAELRELEVILVDDGSTDGTWRMLQNLSQTDTHMRCVSICHSGKDAALWAGFRLCKKPWLAVMDGDGQYDPRDLFMLRQYAERKLCDAVWGYRQDRRDSSWRKAQSWFAAWIKELCLGSRAVHDPGCGLFVARRSHLLNAAAHIAQPKGQVHCHLPDILARFGAVVGECPVKHRLRSAGQAKYGAVNRLVAGWQSLRQARAVLLKGVGAVALPDKAISETRPRISLV